MSNSPVWMLFVFMVLLAIPFGIVIALAVFVTSAASARQKFEEDKTRRKDRPPSRLKEDE